MSTYLQDLRRDNPAKASDMALTGNQARVCLKNMVRALEMLPALNAEDDWRRLAAAKRLLANRY